MATVKPSRYDRGAQRAPRSRYSEDQPRETTAGLPKQVDLDQLCTTIQQDYKDMEPFRRNRRQAVEQFAGSHYGDNAAPVEVPVNLIATYVDVMSRSLVSNNPRVMLSTFDEKQEVAVDGMEAWENEELVRMNAVETFKRCIDDSLYWMGIIKVALADASDAEDSGWGLKAGQPFIEGIDPEDFVCSLSSRRFDRLDYAGHRYRIPVSVANELYAKGRDEQLSEDDFNDVNYGGDESIQSLTRTAGWREEVEPHCTLWEIYLPKHKLIVTLRDDGGVPCSTYGAIRIQPWIGPPSGPYHFLGLGSVPGNLMPLAPIMNLIDLHRAFNNGWRKLIRQTRDYKKNQAYRGQNTEEAKRFGDALDGEMVQSDNPEGIKTIEQGGPSNAVWVMVQAMQQAFEFVGGNMALLGGRGAQSRTATQDKMLNDNASAGVASMQDACQTFVQNVIHAYTWFCWYHPKKVMKSQWVSPSFNELKATRKVGGWNTNESVRREGPMPVIKVDIFTLTRQTPQSRLAFINSVLQMIAPMMQLAVQDGIKPDINALIEIFAKYGDEPDLKKIFHYVTPTAPDQQGGRGDPGAGMKPTVTTRNYNRSSSADSPQAKTADLNASMGSMEGLANPSGSAA